MQITQSLDRIRSLIEETVVGSRVGPVARRYPQLIASGKMLRAKLVARIGSSLKTSPDVIVPAGAAVELMHAGSLLHDDVIDGGTLRRGAPAFWTERGAKGAILVGDLFFFLALRLVSDIDQGRLLQMLVKEAGTVCEAESEQELSMGARDTWSACVDIARRKTGSLFAFAAYAAGGANAALAAALRTSGYEAGTAYQLSDDILDATGDKETSDKTLGTDEGRHTATSMNALRSVPSDAAAHIRRLCRSSDERLAPWPDARAGWQSYLETDLGPALEKNLEGLSTNVTSV